MVLGAVFSPLKSTQADRVCTPDGINCTSDETCIQTYGECAKPVVKEETPPADVPETPALPENSQATPDTTPANTCQ